MSEPTHGPSYAELKAENERLKAENKQLALFSQCSIKQGGSLLSRNEAMAKLLDGITHDKEPLHQKPFCRACQWQALKQSWEEKP